MLTDERIQYFLTNETITEDEYTALVNEYFMEDKTDWYQQNGDSKQWNEVKVKQFWQLIRMHHMPFCKTKKIFYFRKFVFPAFETAIDPSNYDVITQSGDFWEQEEERVFTDAADFSGARFLSNAMFFETTFQKYVNLSHAIFSENAYFKMCIFTKETWMTKTSFKAGANFIMARFKGSTSIKQSKFFQTTSFQGSHFEGALQIDQVLFDSEAKFQETHFNQGVFKDLMGAPELDLSNTVLPKSLTFRKVNLTNSIFTQTDVTEVAFKECDWGNNARIILKGEQNELKTIAHFAELGETYRQLKKNFDGNKDWELSGKAYVSEMEMRKKHLWKQKDYYHWIIYRFYDLFGGYTQDLKRPIISLLGLIAIFSIIYYFIDHSLLLALQRGLYGALPKLITIDIPQDSAFKGYWLIAGNIESILGSTFLVFFILALRKRFKQ